MNSRAIRSFSQIMFDFYQKRKFKTLVTSPITRIFLVVIVCLLAWSAFTRYQIAHDMKVRRHEIEQDVTRLQTQKSALEKQVQYLSDDRGIEAEMRRQFDVALQGEQVVVIVEPDSTAIPSASSTLNSTNEPEWYEFWR